VPAAARIRDPGLPHCSGHTIATGSSDVYVNGQGAARFGDSNTTHKMPGSPCPDHSATINKASGTVFVNGKGFARVGDTYAGCTSISSGSPDVFVGD